jgi:putative ABC transport system permease protein
MTATAIRRELVFAPLLQHKGRLALSVLAIALGVALGYAIQLVNQAALNEFALAAQTLAGEADLEIRGPGLGRGSGFDEALFPRVAGMPEVAVASAVLEADARIPRRREPLKILGLDVFRAARIQPFLAGGDFKDRLDFLRPDRIFLSAAAADWLEAKEGDAIYLQAGLRELPFRVAGILGEGRRQRFAVMDIAAAQAAFGQPGAINRIDLRLRPGVDPARFAEKLQADLPPGAVLERPEADVERGQSLSRAYRVNLNVLALVALFTGGLLVFSAQALAVVRRRAQLALLRVLGMTRGQLVAMLLAEAAAIGTAGALLGLAIGHFIAEIVLRRFGAGLGEGFGAGYFRGLEPALTFDWIALVLFFALGVLAAVIGTLAPALEAARAQPGPALKAGDEQRVFERLQSWWPGVTVMLAGAALTQAGPVRGLPLFGYAAIAFLLFGVIMLMPRFAVLCFRGLPLPGGAPGRIAIAQLRGAPGQAGVSLAAIVASVSLMVSMAIMVASFRQSLDEWLERVLPADLYVRTGLGGETAFLSPADQKAIAAIPGVRHAEFLRSQRLILAPGKPTLTLLARAVQSENRLPPLVGPSLSIKAGDPPPAWVSEIAAELYGWSPGDVIVIPLGQRNASFTVAGIWRDYARQQGAVLIERDEYLRLTGDANANDAALWLDPGAGAESVRRAAELTIPGGANLEIAGPGEIRAISLGIFDRTFAVTYALEAVAVIIGLAGLSSSFGALVLARRREFGMLRHIGMTRAQVGAMLAQEGALVSALGVAAGLALGWLISLVLIHVVNRQSFHWSMELHVPWQLLAEFVAAMLALATVTAILSGRRAMGADVVGAVKEDW